MDYEHLKINREELLTERWTKRGFSQTPKLSPEAKKLHGQHLLSSLEKIKKQEDVIHGFDDRKLIKVALEGYMPIGDLEKIQGVQIVSQESKEIVLAFATVEGLAEFEKCLISLSGGGKVSRERLMLAIKGMGSFQKEDRLSVALKLNGFPGTKDFMLDIELLPQALIENNQKMLDRFLNDLRKENIELLDKINKPSLVMVRVRATRNQAENFLLHHRDVWTIDLPPRSGIKTELFLRDIEQCSVIPPSTNAPVIGILDTGIVSGHPLLRDSIGDTFNHMSMFSNDPNTLQHGTFVAGLALYGDIEKKLDCGGVFKSEFRVLSSRVFDEANTNNDTVLIENFIDKAVRELHEQYGCRIFNLSYGNLNKIYDGGHLGGLAYILDCLTRELNVLFIVPTGNLLPSQLRCDEYPNYLLEEQSRLLDPATAINVLTVGGIARHESTYMTQKHLDMLEDNPIARSDQPYPYTRCGPSIGGAIKPEVVEYAGNVARAIKAANHLREQGLGVISLSRETVGRMFSEGSGTSYAAPVVIHQVAKLLKILPNASQNLLRALVGLHAEVPETGKQLLLKDDKKILPLYGYGKLKTEGLFYSQDNIVTLIAEEAIEKDKCHFFELPVPKDFLQSNSPREISISLAYSPAVKTTRIDYRRTKLCFRFIQAKDLDEAVKAFRKGRQKGEVMGEFKIHQRCISSQSREAGTLQVSRWSFKRTQKAKGPMFLIVTRQDASWCSFIESEEKERYALAIKIAEYNNSELYNNVHNILNIRLKTRAESRIKV